MIGHVTGDVIRVAIEKIETQKVAPFQEDRWKK